MERITFDSSLRVVGPQRKLRELARVNEAQHGVWLALGKRLSAGVPSRGDRCVSPDEPRPGSSCIDTWMLSALGVVRHTDKTSGL